MKKRLLQGNSESQFQVLKGIFHLFSKSERTRILAITSIQSLLGFLDLFGVAIVGVIGSITIRGVSNLPPGDQINSFLQLVGLSEKSLQVQVFILGLLAAGFLILKTILSVYFTRRILFFISRRSATLCKELLGKLFSKPLVYVNRESIQERIYAITDGVGLITLGTVASCVALIADSALLLIIIAGLIFVDPLVAATSVASFLLLGIVLHNTMRYRACSLGNKSATLTVQSSDKIREAISSYREILVSNRRRYYVDKIGEQRLKLADTKAELAFLPSISKYVLELSVVLIALVISAIQFMVQDAPHAIAVLSIFLAASSRVAPAILRMQQSSLMIKSSLGAAYPTLQLISDLSETVIPKEELKAFSTNHDGFSPWLEISNVSFKYPNKADSAISNISVTIQAGQVVAIVGKSGAGKTTLADLILGVLEPSEGEIKISGEFPKKVIEHWPGSIAYVPQDVVISNCSIRENIALGFDPSEIPAEFIFSALTKAQLREFVEQQKEGLDTIVGDRGARLSGGQRQRLGIARALVSDPRVLVLDEATSSLDGQTELDISNSILSLRGERIIIVIAHRLSTIRTADTVIYLENGRMAKQGTFEEVRAAIPDFDQQAQLMGL
jgi:ABC-type multidrug transport system fused ATPase/permease subunit